MVNLSAYSSDVTTLDTIIHAMYEVISGPAAEPRDWKRFRNLYLPGARLIPVISIPGEPARPRLLSPEEYIQRVEPIFATEDFWELEVQRKTETFGPIAHVLSSYESRRAPDGPAFKRGSNSIQLIFDDSRWWIVSVMWNTSRKE
jgi:hypothetical protein